MVLEIPVSNPYKQPLKHKIVGYLRRNGWTPIWKLEDQAHAWPTTDSTISRRCRELSNDGILETRMGKTVQYKLKEQL